MKTKTTLLVLSFLILSLASFSQKGRWSFLGEKVVNDRLDNDIIMVTSLRGDFNAVQIRVKGASVDFKRVIIVFGNGQSHEVELRNTIPAGRSSRIIDLPGKERVIKHIEFWYDANTIKGRKAIVRVFGRG